MEHREYTKIPVISSELHKRLWGTGRMTPSDTAQRTAKEHLASFDGLDSLEPTGDLLELPLPWWLPPYREAIALASEEIAGEFVKSIETMIASEPTLPKPPAKAWIHGWRCNRTGQWVSCDPPHDRILVIDTETVKLNGKNEQLDCRPVNACAFDSEGFWWVWCNDLDLSRASLLIPMGDNNDLILHNANYDRSFFTSAYQDTDTCRYFCTMASMIPVRGISNQQRGIYQKSQSEDADKFSLPPWVDEASTVGLADAYRFYTGQELIKDERNAIWEEGITYVRSHTRDVLEYCLRDVLATHEILCHIWPEYLDSFPNLVTTAGNLILSHERLPMNPKILDFYPRVKGMYQERVQEITDEIFRVAKETCERWLITPSENRDPWERQLGALQMGKSKTKKYPDGKPLYGGDILTSGANKGLPRWFGKLAASYKKGDKLTLHQRITVLLLKIGVQRGDTHYPLIFQFISDKMGSGWTANGKPLVHPDSRNKPVLDVFIKGFAKEFKHGVFTSPFPDLARAISLSRSIQHMGQFQDRYRQMRFYREGDNPIFYVPLTVLMAAISSRTADGVIRVVKNPTTEDIGTSLLNHIEAPPGWLRVGFDFDGQEARIAGMFAEKGGLCTSNPFLVTQLAGDKKSQTDIHSLVAKGVFQDPSKREVAKPLVYALLYNQGLKGAIDYLLAVLPQITEAEAEELAKTFQNQMKGRRNDEGRWVHGLASSIFNSIDDFTRWNAKSPLFNNRISVPLRRTSDFKTTRCNWVIQSTANDMLKIVLVLYEWMAARYEIPTKIILTIHDCMGYLVPEGFEERALFCMATAHAMVWAGLSIELNIDTLSLSGLYPEGFEIDTIWRKNPLKRCETPEYPEGHPPGRIVTPRELFDKFYGEGLDGCPEFSKQWLGA